MASDEAYFSNKVRGTPERVLLLSRGPSRSPALSWHRSPSRLPLDLSWRSEHPEGLVLMRPSLFPCWHLPPSLWKCWCHLNGGLKKSPRKWRCTQSLPQRNLRIHCPPPLPGQARIGASRAAILLGYRSDYLGWAWTASSFGELFPFRFLFLLSQLEISIAAFYLYGKNYLIDYNNRFKFK